MQRGLAAKAITMYQFKAKLLSEQLIQKRTKEGLSLTEAVVACGVNKTLFWRAESGVEPNARVLKTLTAWLGTSMDDYFFRPGFKSETPAKSKPKSKTTKKKAHVEESTVAS